MTHYRKPPLSIQEQLDLLQQRGLAIGDAANAKRYLQRVGYYRLMGYLYTQRVPGSDSFRAQATFEEAVSLYEFDRALRDLVMEAVGHIEVATRTVLTYHFAHAYGAFGHLEPRNLAFTGQEYADWLGGVGSEVTRSREAFIRHYKDKYASPAFPRVPIWMATEVMSLGSLSRFYKALHSREQKAVAGEMLLAAPVFANWLHVTSVARNVVAHHSRLWNKELGVSAVRPRSAGWSEREAPYAPNRCFFLLLLLRKLLESSHSGGLGLGFGRDRTTGGCYLIQPKPIPPARHLKARRTSHKNGSRRLSLFHLGRAGSAEEGGCGASSPKKTRLGQAWAFWHGGNSGVD